MMTESSGEKRAPLPTISVGSIYIAYTALGRQREGNDQSSLASKTKLHFSENFSAVDSAGLTMLM